MLVKSEDVKRLREITCCGFMDCKKSLEEAGGDFDKAIIILKKKGLKIASKRCDNETHEGIVFAGVSSDGCFGCILKMLCETDFVARTEDYKNLMNELLEIAIKNKIRSVEKLNNTELRGMKINEVITELISKVGENIRLECDTLEGEKIGFYNHFTKKLSTLVCLENTKNCENISEIGKNIAMHISAMNPVSIDRNDVPNNILEQEKNIAIEQSANAKDNFVREKMITGKLVKFFKENVLIEQQLVSDEKKSVEQYLKENGELLVKKFLRIEI